MCTALHAALYTCSPDASHVLGGGGGHRGARLGGGGRGVGGRDVLEWGEGGLGPMILCTKMARPEFPNCEFRSYLRWSLWSGGGVGRRGAPPAVHSHSNTSLVTHGSASPINNSTSRRWGSPGWRSVASAGGRRPTAGGCVLPIGRWRGRCQGPAGPPCGALGKGGRTAGGISGGHPPRPDPPPPSPLPEPPLPSPAPPPPPPGGPPANF